MDPQERYDEAHATSDAPDDEITVAQRFGDAAEQGFDFGVEEFEGDEGEEGGGFDAEESWQAGEQVAPSSPAAAFEAAKSYLAGASDQERADFFAAVEQDPGYAQLLNQGFIASQVDARFADINAQVLAVDEIRAERAAIAERQQADQLAEGEQVIEQLVEASVSRGDDAEQVTEYAKQIFEEAGGVQWEASVDDRRAFFGQCVEVARDALRQQSQIRTVLGSGPYPGGSWVRG